MKNGVREGLHIKCKKEEKEFVSEQEEAVLLYCCIFVVSNDLSGKNAVFRIIIKTD